MLADNSRRTPRNRARWEMWLQHLPLLILCLHSPVFAQEESIRPIGQSPLPVSGVPPLPSDPPPDQVVEGDPLEDDFADPAISDDLAMPDDLDDLINLAEQDVGSLAQVKVTAPSLQMEVTTVSRQKSTVGKSPAAIYVITQEMIQRSGATSIPDALRMAPGVQVARLDANKWAISIRGFNGRFANKLLVQIDGRSVYC